MSKQIRRLKNFAHLCLAILANVIYGFPGKKIRVIGVTGTDGKTTTSTLIYHILKTAGHKTALITTVGAYINDELHDTGFHVTTPTAFAMQKFLKQAVDSGHEFAVVETSSHGIDQNRIWGINYEVAVITNITHEHLDYHKTFGAYKQAKLKFMQSAPLAIVNIDDKEAASLLPHLNKKISTYSKSDVSADFTPDKFSFETKLFGDFNVSNNLAAIAACKALGLNTEQIRNGAKTFEAPQGRQNLIFDDGFKVMVDFAHTPNSIENVLKAAKQTTPKRLIHVFGAPGIRDKSKRPLMGLASSRYADVMVITADDPRTEKVSDIIAQVRGGVRKDYNDSNIYEIEDRREAIKFAIDLAQPGDFIVLGGKGHEQTMAMEDGEVPWSDKEVALEILANKKHPRP